MGAYLRAYHFDCAGFLVEVGCGPVLQFQLTINGVAIATAVGGALALQVRPAPTSCGRLWCVNLCMNSCEYNEAYYIHREPGAAGEPADGGADAVGEPHHGQSGVAEPRHRLPHRRPAGPQALPSCAAGPPCMSQDRQFQGQAGPWSPISISRQRFSIGPPAPLVLPALTSPKHDFHPVVCADDEPLISPLLWRNIVGQGVFQLGLMYALVTHGDALFGVPAHTSVHGPSVHYTIVFNVFVLLQLFNQVRCVRKMDGFQLCSDQLVCFCAQLSTAMRGCGLSRILGASSAHMQVNARKIYGEPDVLQGLGDNKLFLYILGGELALQVHSAAWMHGSYCGCNFFGLAPARCRIRPWLDSGIWHRV